MEASIFWGHKGVLRQEDPDVPTGATSEPPHLQAQGEPGAGREGQQDPHRDRGDGEREDHPDHAVPGGGGAVREGQDRVHPASSCGRHECGQEGGGGVWLSARAGGEVGAWRRIEGENFFCFFLFYNNIHTHNNQLQ